MKNIYYITSLNHNIMIALITLLILALAVYLLAGRRVKTPEEEGIH
jgi:hypothetical protein